MTLPLVHLSGTPYQQGLAHGRALQRQIAHNLTLYFDRFEHEAHLSRAGVLLRAQQYAVVLEQHDPAYYAGICGIAAGAGSDLEQLIALNLRYEILYYQFGHNATAVRVPDGCTAFAVAPGTTANGHLFIGENWDWIPDVAGALLHTRTATGLVTLGYTEAGIFGAKLGLNSAGLGLMINGLTTTDDDWTRFGQPFHARCRAILHSQDLPTALAIATAEPRACSANFLLAQTPDQIVDIEVAPHQTRQWPATQGRCYHTNHFLAPRAMGIVEPAIERGPDSDERLARIAALLDTPDPLTINDLQAALRDAAGAPDAICRQPNPADPPTERYATVISAIADLHAQVLWISDGPPDQAPYTCISLADLPLLP